MEKYTLYLGLNDKDTKTQLIGIVEAYKVVMNTLKNKGFDGATIYEATGLYKHESGTFTTEKTLRIEILFATRKDVMELITELKHSFNQESIALQVEKIDSQLV